MAEDGKKQESENPIKICATAVADELDADVLLYTGPVDRPYDRKVFSCCGQNRRTNVLVILITFGGDAHAAYRIARYLQRKYEKFFLMIPGICKSAGTVLALGAHQIVMDDDGELGPLDVQLSKPDELWAVSSGLTASQALKTLQEEAFSMFEQDLLQLKVRSGGQITAKTAAQIATELATGLLRPIYQQIDPMNLGEAALAMQIAEAYGERLAKKTDNLKEGTLEKLIASYPSHGFVIDIDEAQELFKNVRGLSESERKLVTALGEVAKQPSETDAFIAILSSRGENDAASDGSADTEGTESQTGATPGGAEGKPVDAIPQATPEATAEPATSAVSAG
jgi:hypothetical protein